MSEGIEALDFFRQEGFFERLEALTHKLMVGILEAAQDFNLPIAENSAALGSDVWIAQSVIGVIGLIIVGVTFLPFGATSASIKACQLNTDQKLVKYGGVVIAITTSLSAILYLEVLRLYGILEAL
ncbi:hypothetical protein [Prochlorococcus sp. MIT 1341]|uniref:hypothetical protein n=1 Tax=Prochlorococcus sp. MIT 1341 TaxID=3096221 RepID=UPI002A75AB5D|nr:hypothetical protein [Prochlorococcus sp. MIT 1341]